jgi:DNA-binding MarR family transcriptional regulator
MATAASALQREIRQSRPFRSKRQEAALGLLRTADLVRRVLTSVLEPHGVTAQQYNVLRILRGAGSEGLPTLEIANRMVEQSPGITRLLDRIEAKGWVARERCPKDRRQMLCTITRAGLELLAQLDAPMDSVDDLALASMSESQISTLIRLLDKARASCEQTLAQPTQGE